ncbi:glutathione transferase [Ranunculus cassubicifolius]
MGAIELLPKEYGYVVLALALYSLVNFWMGFKVGGARRKYKVFYPTLYASAAENKDANVFNCIQRGHQNSLEMMPMFYLALSLGGLQHPCVATALGLVYTVGRIVYFLGYSTGEPKNRMYGGGVIFLSLFGLIGCTISLGVHLLI